MATWAPILTAIRDHRRSAQAGDRAMWLYVCMHLFSHERATNGRVSVHELNSLSAQRGKLALTKRLVSAGFLTELDDGWEITKYNEKGPKAAAVSQKRDSAAERQRQKRERDKRDSHALRHAPREEKRREEKRISANALIACAPESSLFARTDLQPTLDRLEAIWPKARCVFGHEHTRLEALVEALNHIEPDALVLAAEKSLSANGWDDHNIDGCCHLDRWLRERRWDHPLPKPKNSAEATVRNRRDHPAQIEAMTAEIIELADHRGEILDEQEARRYAEVVVKSLTDKARIVWDSAAGAAGITLDNLDHGRLRCREVTIGALAAGRLVDVEGVANV